MNHFYTILLCSTILFGLSSCKSNNKETNRQTTNLSDSISTDNVTDTIFSIPASNELTIDSTRFCYLISGYFEDQDTIRKKFPLIEKRKWNVLTYIVDERKFYLKPVELDTLYWHDDCNGVDMLSVMNLEQKKQIKKFELEDNPNKVDYIYISGLNCPTGEISSHFHTEIGIDLESPYSFDFNGKQYTLRAEGEYAGSGILCNARTKNYMGRLQNYVDGYKDYKLYLEADGIKQLLNSGSYSSTCLQIHFIGDLDGDGKPDFLFETNTWYEGSEVTLFLSSKADKGELVKNMGASGNYYSC